MSCQYCGQGSKTKTCFKCASRRYRKKNPLRASYVTLKYNAKRRGKSFGLTFEQYKAFAVKAKLMTSSGRDAESYAIDRIDSNKGYTIDNLQILTNKQNGEKAYLERIYKYIEGTGLRLYTRPNDLMEDCPF
jgi:hypothetical protein